MIKLNQSIVKITHDIENFELNTVVSTLMEINNEIENEKNISENSYKIFLKLLFPAAPHIAEELWEKSGFSNLIESESWPKADQNFLKTEKVTIAVQIDGKLRATMKISPDLPEDDAKKEALNLEKIKKHLAGKKIKKTIYVPGRILNLVI